MSRRITNTDRQDLNLVHWLLETLSRHEEEVIKVYIPALLELRLQVEVSRLCG